MTDQRLEEIKERLKANAYFVNPLSDAHVADDMAYLLGLLGQKEKELETVRKKNEVLSEHVTELTQEMENIKSDFGNMR